MTMSSKRKCIQLVGQEAKETSSCYLRRMLDILNPASLHSMTIPMRFSLVTPRFALMTNQTVAFFANRVRLQPCLVLIAQFDGSIALLKRIDARFPFFPFIPGRETQPCSIKVCILPMLTLLQTLARLRAGARA